MTKCTEALRLLTDEERRWCEDAGYDESGERIAPASKSADRMPIVLRRLAEARLAQPTPACDAEKAVLVESLGWCVDRFGHQATCNYSALSGEGCNCDMARVLRLLADPSPAAAALLAQGEALKAAWPYLWHTRDCISVVGQVASGHPCDCGFTEMIELVKEARGQACP